MQEVTRKPDEKKDGGIVTIQKVVSREVFWHLLLYGEPFSCFMHILTAEICKGVST